MWLCSWTAGIGWKILRSMIEKAQVVSRNIYVNTFAIEHLEESEEFGKENVSENNYIIKNIFDRNMDIESSAVEGIEGNEKHVIGKRRKGNPCYILVED